MESVTPVRIAALTRNGELAERLERLSRHWAEAVCVLTAPAAPADADILFWDADTCPLRDAKAAPLPPPRTVIVISGDEARAIDAYQLHPAAFLRPNLTAADFRGAMGRCFPAWRGAMRWLTLAGRRELPIGGIHYIEAGGHESAAHCANAVFTLAAPLRELLEQLPAPPFLRCQRSFIVRLSAVRLTPDGNLITAQEGRVIPVSRKLSDSVRAAWERWNALETQ